MRKFIAKVQNSDETTKKFWVFACSAISMLMVISLWTAYSNLTIAKVPGPNSGQVAINSLQQAGNKENEIEKPGFFAIFGAGTKIIFDALKARLSVKHDIVIQKQEINFISADVEPIKGAKLP